MKMTQKKTFQPITIILETPKEVEALLNACDNCDIEHKTICRNLSNWFSREAHFERSDDDE